MDLFDLVATIRVNLEDFDRGLDEAQRRAKNFASGLEGVGSGLKDIASPAVKGFQAVENVGGKALNAVKTGMKGFTAASAIVGGFGATAVKAGAEFDATMSEVSAISGATGNEFDSLRDKALEMGAKTKFSASEAASAMTYMGMAGWKAGDMISGIEGIMNLAAASGEDLATTSDIVTDALTAFGLQASDSGHFANVMAVAASNANTNVGMMGETFKYVAPVAGALGYSVDDTALAIGLMANSGIKATQAGTALRSIFSRLSTDAGASSKKLGALGVLTQQLGVEFYNTDGTARDLNDVLIDSRAAWAGLSEEQQITYAKTIAGQEAMSGWLALMNASPADVEKLTNALEDCNGAAEKMAATMVDNLQGDLTLLGSAFESLQIAISDSLTPTLREFAQFGQRAMSNLLQGFQSDDKFAFYNVLSGVVTEGLGILSARAADFVQVSTNFVIALSNGILGAKNQLLSAGKDVIDFLIDVFGDYLRNVSPEMAQFGSDIVTMIFDGFIRAGNVISDVIGNFVPLIAQAFLSYHAAISKIGLDILAAIGKGIVDQKDKIREIASSTITNMVTALRENAPAIIEGAIALIEALAGALMDNMPLILEAGAEIVGKLVEGISGSLPTLALAIGPILIHIGTIIETVGKIKDVVKTVVEFVAGGSGIGKIIEVGKTLMSGIQALFGLIMAHPVIAVITAIIAAIVLLWTQCEEFRDFVGNMVESIIGFFSGLYEGISSALSGIAEVIGGAFSSAWEAVQAAWSGAVDFFTGVWEGIQTAFSAAVEFFATVWAAIVAVFSVVEEVLGGFFRAAWEAVKTAWEAATEFFGSIAAGIRSAFEEATEFLSNAFKQAWEAVKAAWGAAVDFFRDVWNGIKEIFGVAVDFFGKLFSAAWEAVKEAWSGVKSFFSGVWQDIKDVWDGVTNAFRDIGRDMLMGLWNGISDKVSWLKSKVSGVVDKIKSWFTGRDGFDTHSPSKWSEQVFRNVMEGGANGLDSGRTALFREVDDITDSIKRSMSFSPVSIGMNAYGNGYGTGAQSQAVGVGGGNNFNFTFNSPKALDPVSAAREAKKAAQQIALGYL